MPAQLLENECQDAIQLHAGATRTFLITPKDKLHAWVGRTVIPSGRLAESRVDIVDYDLIQAPHTAQWRTSIDQHSIGGRMRTDRCEASHQGEVLFAM